MKNNEKPKFLNDEELQNINASGVSKTALAGIIAGSIIGAAIIATAVGVPLAQRQKKKKDTQGTSVAPTPENIESVPTNIEPEKIIEENLDPAKEAADTCSVTSTSPQPLEKPRRENYSSHNLYMDAYFSYMSNLKKANKGPTNLK